MSAVTPDSGPASAGMRLARLIDALNETVGRWLSWLVLLAVLISAGNALVRKLFDNSSNALLEIQWYLFAALFLLGAGYTLLRQEHVKIDVLLQRFERRTQVKVELFGIVCFLWPFSFAVIGLVWPLVARAFLSGEMSSNAGGLVRWPVYALVPAGFLLLSLQGLSELLKRLAFLTGRGPDPSLLARSGPSAEEALAESIRQQSGQGVAR